MLYKEFQSQQARRMRSQEQARQPSEISCVLVDSQKKKIKIKTISEESTTYKLF